MLRHLSLFASLLALLHGPTLAQSPSDAAPLGITVKHPAALPTHGQFLPVVLPPSARLAFHVRGEIKKFRYTAKAELLWHNRGDHYEAQQHIRAFLVGTRSQRSTGSIAPYGLQPAQFQDIARQERSAQLNFATREATFSDDSPKAAITPGTQDRLSIFIQVGAMLAAAPEQYPTGTQIAFLTVGARHADQWIFTVEGEETLQLPTGNIQAVKLQRLPRPGNERDRGQKAELWLGRHIGWLPVRIRMTQETGDFVDLSLTQHEAL